MWRMGVAVGEPLFLVLEGKSCSESTKLLCPSQICDY
jgi:hypothetical protein